MLKAIIFLWLNSLLSLYFLGSCEDTSGQFVKTNQINKLIKYFFAAHLNSTIVGQMVKYVINTEVLLYKLKRVLYIVFILKFKHSRTT